MGACSNETKKNEVSDILTVERWNYIFDYIFELSDLFLQSFVSGTLNVIYGTKYLDSMMFDCSNAQSFMSPLERGKFL